MSNDLNLLKEIREKQRDDVQDHSIEKFKVQQAIRYYFGQQWDADLMAYLALMQKPALTYNYIAKTLNFTAGLVSKMQIQEKFLPQNKESEPFVDIATGLLKYIYLTSHADAKFKQVFKLAALTGQAFMRPYLNHLRNPNGEIALATIDPTRVFWDRSSIEPDWSDNSRVWEALYLSKSELTAIFPEYAKDIELLSPSFFMDVPVPTYVGAIGDYGELWGSSIGSFGLTTKMKKLEVIRFQEKVQETKLFLYDVAQEMYYPIPQGLTKDDISHYVQQASKQKIKLEMRHKKVQQIKLTTYCGDLIFEDLKDPYGVNEFDIVPCWGYKLEQGTKGLFHDAQDPQDEINKRKSLGLEILRNAPKLKWFVDKMAFTSNSERDEAENSVNDDDTHFIAINHGAEKPTPMQSDLTQVLNALVSLEQRSEMQLKDLAGFTDAIMGQIPRKIQSGAAIANLQAASMVPMTPLLDNFMDFRKNMAYLTFEIAKRSLPQDFIFRIDTDDSSEFARINTQLGGKEKINFLNMVQAKLDVAVDMQDNTPTMRVAKLESLMKARQMGFPIPPELILDLLDIPYKYKQQITQEMKQMQQQQAQAPQQAPQKPPSAKAQQAAAQQSPYTARNPLISQ